ncbi:MAG: protein phosphatase 2C family protein [Brachymonas sp.]|nr:protein phosphatase 2C family protein [Brachymonas sp.]
MCSCIDGHSGDAVAKWLHDNLQEYVAPAMAQSTSPEVALSAAFTAADKELLQLLAPEPTENGVPVNHAGATASVALITSSSVTTANIGDSSCVLWRQGKDMLLTTTHRVYGKCATASNAHNALPAYPHRPVVCH